MRENRMTDLERARQHLARARQIQRSLRLRRYDGRNSDFTMATLRTHQDEADQALASLDRRLRGLVTGENRLAERISLAHDHDQQRPELRKRLAALRREIRSISGLV